MSFRQIVMIAVFIIFPTLLATGQTSTFSVKTEEVRIDVLVTDDGKPVIDLHAENFEVRDNGVPQVIETVSYQRVPTSATLVLDMSRSVTGELFEQLKRAGNELLNGLRDKDRAALITFSHSVMLDSPRTTDLDSVKLALHQLQPRSSGNTSLLDVSYTGLIYAESKADRSLLVIFSDGLDTTSWLTEEEVLESAKRSDVVVYTISAGRLPDNDFLRDLAKYTGGYFFKIESIENLGAIFRGILDEFRHRYMLTYSPRGVKKSGWHEIEVRVRKHRYDKIQARPGYMMESTEDEY